VLELKVFLTEEEGTCHNTLRSLGNGSDRQMGARKEVTLFH
jgi:hypothetical protein